MAKPPTKEAAALLELERRMLAGDQSITPELADKITAKLDAYRQQGALPQAGGKPVPEGSGKRYEDEVGIYSNLKNSVEGFQDNYAGNTWTGELENFAQGRFNTGTPGQRDWWAAFKSTDNLIRNQLFGASLTPGEKQSYEATTISPSMSPAEVRKNIERRAEIIRGAMARKTAFLKANGFNRGAVDALAGEYADDFKPKPAKTGDDKDVPPVVGSAAAGDAGPPPGDPNVPLGDIPPDTGIGAGAITDVQGAFGDAPQGAGALNRNQMTVTTSGPQSADDPELAGLREQVAGMIAAGATANSIRNYLTSAGINPEAATGIDEVVAFRKAHPEYKGGYNVQIGASDVPMSATRSAIAKVSASPAGAYGMQAADQILLGGLDEIAPGNSNLNRLGIDQVAAANPKSALAGTITGIGGNVATALGGESLLAGGVPALGRFAAPIADTAFGAANGALSNNDDRLTGALTGGLAALGGGVLGRTTISGLGKVISPSGGKLGALYEEGVRPTIGQRFVGTGIVGNAVNGAEEVLQSIPGLGFAVRGARQKARDQFERGGFDSALGEIGQRLGKDTELGTAAHKEMQGHFNAAYDKVRGLMNFVPDADYAADFTKFQSALDSGVLSADQATRVRKIVQDAVDSRVAAAGGEALTGDAYKAAISSIESKAGDLAATDPLMSKALKDYAGIFDAAARRNTPAAAVEAMDAVDRGYAKSVIIEDAARRRGGDTGRFSPTQFDAAVQNMSGGVRSRRYLKGDALFGDYAEAGKSLVDRIPNSGTTDRLLATQALAGAPVISALGFASPVSAALVGAATLPYAPIVRDGVGAVLAPRSNKFALTLGDLIRQRAQLGGAAGAPLALSATGQ